MVNSLHKVDFAHPTGHYTWKNIAPLPLEKILGAPLILSTQFLRDLVDLGFYLEKWLLDPVPRNSWARVGLPPLLCFPPFSTKRFCWMV